MEQNLIWSAFRAGVKKFLFLGSACMYPKECPQPMKEEMLLTGLPEYTNEGYALAKIGGQRLCAYLREQAPILPICFKSTSVLMQTDVLTGLKPTMAEPFYNLSDCTIRLREN